MVKIERINPLNSLLFFHPCDVNNAPGGYLELFYSYSACFYVHASPTYLSRAADWPLPQAYMPRFLRKFLV
jgi:hypothetical protein